MVLFDQNNFRLNKTGLHMVDTWSVHPNLTLLTSRVCLDVTMRALSREHGELLSDWLSSVRNKTDTVTCPRGNLRVF